MASQQGRSATAASGPGDKENEPPASAQDSHSSLKRKASSSAPVVSWGPSPKLFKTDPLVGHGRHFGRTIRTFCRVHILITNGLTRTMQLELGRITEGGLSTGLLSLSPGLEERLNTGSDQDLHHIGDNITKGIASARSDDTKSLKAAVVDWITPENQILSPPLPRNVKADRGFYHTRTGELLCPVNLNWNDEKIRRDLKSGLLVPSGDLWPRFIYRNYEYNPEEPWEGLLRSSLLVKAYKHVFTSPSSVLGTVSKATRSSNARIHGMTVVSVSSLAYIATQVRFALSSSAVFSRTDHVTDSEYFYNLIIDLLEDENEEVEVAELMKWWNQQIFPTQANHARSIGADSVIAKIHERRRLINAGLWNMREVALPGASN